MESGKVLGRNLCRGFQRLPGHEYPQHAVRLRGDGETGVVCVGIRLEGDEVIGVLFHPGEPVDDELVGLPAVQAQAGQGVLQKGGGFAAGDAEALREVVSRIGNTLPL